MPEREPIGHPHEPSVTIQVKRICIETRIVLHRSVEVTSQRAACVVNQIMLFRRNRGAQLLCRGVELPYRGGMHRRAVQARYAGGHGCIERCARETTAR